MVWSNINAAAIGPGKILEIVERSIHAGVITDRRTRGQQMIIAGAVRLIIDELRTDSCDGVLLCCCLQVDGVVLYGVVKVLVGKIVTVFVVSPGASHLGNSATPGLSASW